MNLDFAKVCGKHTAIYEAYYKQIDPKGSGAIEAMTAAKFLKKSGLSDVVLSRVWDLSDPNGKGFLDKPGFFVALKLVSLAQAGQVINMSNIYTETVNPPKVGDLPKIIPPRVPAAPGVGPGVGSIANADWSIGVIDRIKYEQLFESLKPVGGMLPGNKVKGVLMDSKLPMETLGKIWDLADQDKDGNLDKHEFIVAMHLVYQTLEKRIVPDVLPPELRKSGSGGAPPPKPMPPVNIAPAAAMPRAPSGEGFGDGGFVANFPKDIAPPPAIQPLPVAIPPMTRVPPVGGVQPLISSDPLIPIGAPPSVTASADWVITPDELKRYEIIFRDSDRDKDGLVSGLEIKNVFIQSGVPQNCLAHIWALCDTNQSGKLTLDQFALAMWMVERKQKGIEPPHVLTANMVPPSLRGVVSGVDLQPQAEPKPTYSNPELEMISKEIEELAKERRALETEIAQKEADIRIKSGEVRSLQSELDTLSATLKQLENQRGEAQKRLDDLKAQSIENTSMLASLNIDISQKRYQVSKVREQCQKQEDTINEQEGELNAKRSELQKLKDEEVALQKEYDENNRELQKLTHHLQSTQLQISSVRSKVTELMETQRQMTDALIMCRAAIENQDAELVKEYQLKLEPDFDNARILLEKKIEEPKADPFGDDNSKVAKTSNGFASNGFASDPFTSNVSNTIRTGFDDSFNTTNTFDTGFDAFSGSSAFGQQKDPFGGDAFGASRQNAITPEPGKDDFGSDPFAALHAPTGQGQVLSPNTQKSGPPPRPESPSPALPPKKSKVPPPRPAPPRPLQAPARPTQPAMDAFGSTSTSGGFADFADFDNKLPIIPPSTSHSTTFNTLSTASQMLSSSSSLFDIVPTNITPAAAATTSSLSTSSPTTLRSARTPPNTIAATITNNHLTRSTTPLQQAASALITTNAAVDKCNVPAISGPTDFADDPFKDYRYEDPFNIKDPFADEEDATKMFPDALSSDDDIKHRSSFSINSSQSFEIKPTPLNSELLESFDAFNINPSPISSQQSSSGAVFSDAVGKISATSTGSSYKSQSNTPIPDNFVGSRGSAVFDNFADFDTFSTKSNTSAMGISNGNPKSTNDSFYDAFNDKFDANSNVQLVQKSSEDTVFDAFGDTKSFDAFNSEDNLSTTANVFEAFTPSENITTNKSAITLKSTTKSLFDDSFEDNFFKINKPSTLKDNDLNFNAKKNANNNSFADSTDKEHSKQLFQAFDDNFAVQNLAGNSNESPRDVLKSNMTLTKTLNKPEKENGARLAEKFAADYSKPETFEDDLQKALKLSEMEM